jgi:hydrogenase maturation protein HypF
MLADTTRPVAERAACFHLSLAQALAEQAQQLRAQTGIQTVGLTGGVFQNRLLAEAAIEQLEAAGFAVHLPRRIPVNDAGLSFGQVIEYSGLVKETQDKSTFVIPAHAGIQSDQTPGPRLSPG